MEVLSTLTIDLLKPKILQPIHAKQNDKGSRYISVFLYEGHDKFVIPSGAHATIRIRKPKGAALFYDADEYNNSAIEIQDNKITFLLIEQALTDFGNAHCEINLYTNDTQRLTSFFFTIEIEKSVIDDATIVSSDYFNILTEQIAIAVNAAETAAHAPEPRNGTWWIWDAVSGEYVDTGQPSFETGPSGAAATVTIGDVETVPYGTSAAITNVGTNTDAVLNFEIPEGKPGEGGGGGSGDVSTVNNIAPVDGNITLTAEDVGAVKTPSIAIENNIAIFTALKGIQDSGMTISDVIAAAVEAAKAGDLINPTLYVNGSTGNDSNDGVAGLPFKTLARAIEIVTTTSLPYNVTITCTGNVGPLVVGNVRGPGQLIITSDSGSTFFDVGANQVRLYNNLTRVTVVNCTTSYVVSNGGSYDVLDCPALTILDNCRLTGASVSASRGINATYARVYVPNFIFGGSRVNGYFAGRQGEISVNGNSGTAPTTLAVSYGGTVRVEASTLTLTRAQTTAGLVIAPAGALLG